MAFTRLPSIPVTGFLGIVAVKIRTIARRLLAKTTTQRIPHEPEFRGWSGCWHTGVVLPRSRSKDKTGTLGGRPPWVLRSTNGGEEEGVVVCGLCQWHLLCSTQSSGWKAMQVLYRASVPPQDPIYLGMASTSPLKKRFGLCKHRDWTLFCLSKTMLMLLYLHARSPSTQSRPSPKPSPPLPP